MISLRKPVVEIAVRYRRAKKVSDSMLASLRLAPRRKYYEVDGQVYWAVDAGAKETPQAVNKLT